MCSSDLDELHLLSGPLGTIASLYEIAVDAIVSSAGEGHARPKILASTATIRTAGSQVQGLLGRSVATFPVSGTDPDDSFWAVKDDGMDKEKINAVSALLKKIGSVNADKDAVTYDGFIDPSIWKDASAMVK